jgi:ribosomal protein S18 acetylase RimI-like enzyme
MTTTTWRLASPKDDEAIVARCLALYREDPAGAPVPAGSCQATLARLRAEPARGRAVVLEHEGRVAGYALLISFWSTELGGELCTIDELYVDPEARSGGRASALVRALMAGEGGLWPGRPVALELEVTPTNGRARALYERLGFAARKNATLRWRADGAALLPT